jgi:AAA ATPase domain
MDAKKNPYRTAPGSDPPELAGRTGEVGAAGYAIQMTKANEPAKPLVFTGLRGVGKTALLRRVVRDVKAAGGLTIAAEADPNLRLAEVMRRDLNEALGRSAGLPARLRSSLAKLVSALAKVAYELPHGGGGISLEAHDVRDHERVIDALEDAFYELNDHVHEHGRFLTIAIDEVQDCPATDLLRIIRVVHSTAGTDRPVLFVGAGLPASGAVLQAVRTYTERWAYYMLPLLTRSETEAAVDVPARDQGESWQQDAIDELFARSGGYPYFIQEYASAAWLQHRGKNVSLADVMAVATGVQRLLDEGVYDRQFADLTPREATYVLALHRLGPGIHHAAEIAEVLKTGPEAQSSIRAQLVRKDALYSAGRGLTEFRIPLTNGYIKRNLERFVRRAGVSLVRRRKQGPPR